MRRAENLEEHRFVRADPFWRRQTACGPPTPFTGHVLLFHEHEHTREQALEQMEDVRDGLARMAHRWEERAVEDHLPLDPALGREERGRMLRQLQVELRHTRNPAGRTEWRRAFDREEDTRSDRLLSPSVFSNKLVLENEQPRVSACVQRAERVGARERDTGPFGPFVHLLDVGRKHDLRGAAHGRGGSGGLCALEEGTCLLE